MHETKVSFHQFSQTDFQRNVYCIEFFILIKISLRGKIQKTFQISPLRKTKVLLRN